MWPIPSNILAAGALLLAMLFSGWTSWTIQDWRYRLKLADAEQALAASERALAVARTKVADTVTEFVVIKERQRPRDAIINNPKAIEHHVPPTLPMLPSGFRVLHDAAASGVPPDDTQGTDAAPVAPTTVAKTLARNYTECRADQQRLEALQAIVRALGVQESE